MRYHRISAPANLALGPFISEDGKTIHPTAPTAAKIKIAFDGTGNQVASNVTNITALGDGMYSINIPAATMANTGGAIITCKLDGALIVFCEIFIVTQAYYDFMVDPGVVSFPANIVKVGGTTISGGKVPADIGTAEVVANVTKIKGTAVLAAAAAGKFPTDTANDANFATAIAGVNNATNAARDNIKVDTALIIGYTDEVEGLLKGPSGLAAIKTQTAAIATDVTTALSNTATIKSKLPADNSNIASTVEVRGIQNNTNFVCSLPDTVVIPKPNADGSQKVVPFMINVFFYDENGNMEDPNGSVGFPTGLFGIQLLYPTGTNISDKLYTSNALTTQLITADGAGMSTYKGMTRISAGHYICFYKATSDDPEAQVIVNFMCYETNEATAVTTQMKFGRSVTALSSQTGVMVLADTTSNKQIIASAIKELDTTYMPTQGGSIQAEIIGNIGTTIADIGSVAQQVLTVDNKVETDKSLIIDTKTKLDSVGANVLTTLSVTQNVDSDLAALAPVIAETKAVADAIKNGTAQIASTVGTIDLHVNTVLGTITDAVLPGIQNLDSDIAAVSASIANIPDTVWAKTIDGKTASQIQELVLARTAGRFKVDHPSVGVISFYKQDGTTILAQFQYSDKERIPR